MKESSLIKPTQLKENAPSKAMLERLPLYLQFLKTVEDGTISATQIARNLNFGEVQVRKDLGTISGSGKPKVGYDVKTLIEQLRSYLCYDVMRPAVIVGAGHLGTALLQFSGFHDYGLNIVGAFDNAVNTTVSIPPSDKKVYPISYLKSICQENNVQLGIICVPESQAQNACDALIDAGILAILNFASARLCVPDNIVVKQENMASALAVLSEHLKQF